MRKKSNFLPSTYWLANSLDGAEHNKYIVKISLSHKPLESEHALGTRLSKVLVSKNLFKKISMAKSKTKWGKKTT